MLRSCHWLAAVAICVMVAPLSAEVTNIPDHLLDCYQNRTMYHRENRFPSTIENLVELLRTIEQHQDFNMDMRNFALSLVHLFRVDGIERNPNIQEKEHTIPFGLTGNQFWRYRLLVQNLIPQPSATFPNSSLTAQQKCSLHFMLSNSVDATVRGDESYTCNGGGYTPYRRNRREVPVAPVAPADPGDDSGSAQADDVEMVPNVQSRSAEGSNLIPNVQTHSAEGSNPAPDSAPAPVASSHETGGNPEAEMINVNSSGSAQRKGDMMWNSDGAGPAQPAAGRAVARGAAGRGKLVENPVVPAPRAADFGPKSQCPVENGVVLTDWGTVQAGTLIAAIAAGLEPQKVAVKDIRSKKTETAVITGNEEVDNRWAATLAGDLAEVAIFAGPSNTGVLIGATGKWNSSQTPRWHFIQRENDMTDAEIRADVDGLIMATHIREWNNDANGNLKLSTVLEGYYSVKGVLGSKYRACNRQDHYKEVAPTADMQKQALYFAVPLQDSASSAVYIHDDGIKEYADAAVSKLDQYIPRELGLTCPTPASQTEETAAPRTDLTVVVDCQFDLRKFNTILNSLGRRISLMPIESGSTITTYSGNEFQTLFNTTNSLSILDSNLRRNATVYGQCANGLDIKKLLDLPLRDLYREKLERERNETGSNSNPLNPTSHIVVIVPTTGYSPSDNDLNEAEKLVNEYREKFPDVKFLYFVSGSTERYKELVESQEQDIITFVDNNDPDGVDIKPLAQRISEVHRRIVNPRCGEAWKDGSYNEFRYEDYIANKHIIYYRIHSRYLFGSSSTTVKIREEGTGSLTVCYSRNNPYPSADGTPGNGESSTSDDVQCTELSSSETVISLSNPCGDSKHFLGCRPLYISATATNSRNQCSEKKCKDVDSVKVSISHSGLTCGVAAFLASPLTIVLTAAILGIYKSIFAC